jgi:spore maturation protein CgeB
MKILYTAFKYDYADKKRGYSYEHLNFWDTFSRISNNTVIYFPVDENIMKYGRRKMNELLIDITNNEKPDILFCNLFTNEIYPKTIKYITNETDTITLNWFSDDQWRFNNFSRYWAPFFDWVITTDPLAVDKYHSIGYNNVIKSQYAANPNLYKPKEGHFKYDVSFIGSSHTNRRKMIDDLIRNHISVECWGSGWKNGRISHEDALSVISQSKINLNFTEVSTSTMNLNTLIKMIAKIFLRRGINSTYHFFPLSIIFRNIINFSLPESRLQIKGRNFEIPATGGFLLTQDAEDLYNFYEYGKEIVVFKNFDELIKNIKYYLEHEEERARIGIAGYERTIKDHIWENRFKEIFNIISSNE